MNIWKNYQSPFGYHVGYNGIDSYGVDHSGFSLRDEIEYQTARNKRENQMMQMYNQQGINGNYPQYGTNFWGNAGNNYGFGASNISSAISAHPAMNTTPVPIMQTPQTSLKQQNYSTPSFDEAQRRHNLENELLMDGMDTLYGMNRAINGVTFGGLDYMGNKFGFDAQMNNYLQLKNPQERELAQNIGQLAQWGGSALTGTALAKTGLNQANMAYNGYKIGRAYDRLSQNPYQGQGTDVIARMKNHNDEPVVLQRGEAIRGENGQPVVHGGALKGKTGTKQNFGLDKFIYRHNISRADAQQIPRIIQRKPFETNEFGQNVYIVRNPNGTLRVITSPTSNGSTVSSMYYYTK